MRVIFLDIDGVLNSEQSFLMHEEMCKKRGIAFENKLVDPWNVWNLNFVLRNVLDVRLVIHSTWRTFGLPSLKSIFQENGIDTDRLMALTRSYLPKPRSIKVFLKDYPQITKYVVIDDHPMSVGKRQVRTDGSVGLTLCDARAVIKLLNENDELSEVV